MKNILLVNPWIYDFAAYDFWNKPVGLLSIGAVLRQLGYQINLVDCLDRHHPRVLQWQGLSQAKSKLDGTGKYYRCEVQKPQALKNIPRRFCRYGMPPELFDSIVGEYPNPSVILVTSGMTYWYLGFKEAVERLRLLFPSVPIVLGGIYATLCPEHARRTIKPDVLIEGEGEEQIVQLVRDILGESGLDYRVNSLDELLSPAYDLYPNLISVPILTSRGCPYDCTFCASRQLVSGYHRRSPQKVIDEICHWHFTRGVNHFAFFDDALLVNRNRHIKPILSGLIDKEVNACFHTPNGLHPKEIDRELAELMIRSGFKTIRLSYETSNPVRQREMQSKVSDNDLVVAIENLEAAGYARGELGVYVLMGLPGQEVDEIIKSIAFVLSLGAKVHLASFSPTHGTREFQRAVDLGLLPEDVDPILTNNSIFPLSDNNISYETFEKIKKLIKRLNQRLSVDKIHERDVWTEFEKELV